MSTNAPHAPGQFGEPPARPHAPDHGPVYYALKGLKALASLQLTVVLFVFSILLVFFGTLAQLDNGIWTVVDTYFYSLAVMVPFELIHKFLNVFWKESYPAGTDPWVGAFPLPGGFTLGVLMLTNLLAAHALRFRLSWKRLGIFLIHGGLILLFVGEFITREYAIEQQMTIPEGSSANYAEDTRNVELALIDKSDPTADHVVVVSQKRLAGARRGQRISNPDLPVDIEVVRFMKNSDLKDPGPNVDNPATAGVGREVVAVPVKEEAGVETKQKGDIPSAYLRFYAKGTDTDLGTYLASRFLPAETVRLGDAPYRMSLRPARYYKSYSVHLDKFRFDRYEGTQKPRNYSSDVRVYDEAGNLVRQQRIAMNEPLRYEGETFYQSSFDKSETTTVLQVVRNPGWQLPYLACFVVGLGLILHFGIAVTRFLVRHTTGVSNIRSRDADAAPVDTPAPTERSAGATLSGLFPWVMLGLVAVFLFSVFGRLTPSNTREPYDLDAFARIPVIEGGRVKPLETVARVYLRTVSHRETFVDPAGKTQPAIRWYLDLIAAGSLDDDSTAACRDEVFRIENDQVRADLKLPLREGLRYSMKEMRPRLRDLEEKATVARKKVQAKKPVDLAGLKMIELEEHIVMVRSLSRLKGLNASEQDTLRLLPPENGGGWRSLGDVRDEAEVAGLVATQRALRLDPKRLFKMTSDEQRRTVRALSRFDLDQLPPEDRTEVLDQAVRMMQAAPAKIPPEFRASILEAAFVVLPETDVIRIKNGIEADYRTRLAASPAALGWERMITAAREDKPAEFNKAVAEYREKNLSGVPAAELVRTRLEVVYNRFAPFYQCTGLYVLGFILALVGFILYVAECPDWAVALRRSAFLVLAVTLAVHTAALVGRMYIMDRPLVFVTNLYSSAVFIGWGCVTLCLVLELIFRLGIGNVVAAVLGLATTIVAHNLGTQDTLEMMEAVLDTNFWLATHVTTVTLGYTATFVAGFLAAVYVLMMLGAVIRDSFRSTAEPTAGGLAAFGLAAVGVVGIPLAFLAFMTIALAKYDLIPSDVLWGAFYLLLACGACYALALMLLRVGPPQPDPSGAPGVGRVPGPAQPVAVLALTPESGKILGQMVYGVVCFATMLSFIGTVLGGIWADQSWGRFWGWDPKENGAILIVLWNALILHARWCGLVKDRGVAVLAVLGNTITAWSWFGTNQLGIGLHAYGFDSRLADGCFNFWLSQLFIAGVGAAIPRHFWAGAARRPVAVPVSVANTSAPATTANGTSDANTNPSAVNGTANGNGHANGQSRREKRRKNRRT
jgi:ABC-type transport system involved in cytochrome c biogenesis permease subunit